MNATANVSFITVSNLGEEKLPLLLVIVCFQQSARRFSTTEAREGAPRCLLRVRAWEVQLLSSATDSNFPCEN